MYMDNLASHYAHAVFASDIYMFGLYIWTGILHICEQVLAIV